MNGRGSNSPRWPSTEQRVREFIVIDAPQRSPEWYAARCGRLTGSRADVILAKARGKGESVQRRDYRLQLIAERLLGESQESLFWTLEMQRGVDLEPKAFGAYEAEYGAMVNKTGFLQHTKHMAGCSLDGDINDFSGIVELKCPKMATHLGYLGNPPSLYTDYGAQVRHNLWVSGATFCDLISFDDRLGPLLQLCRLRIERRDAQIPEYEIEALKFLSEVDAQFKLISDGAIA